MAMRFFAPPRGCLVSMYLRVVGLSAPGSLAFGVYPPGIGFTREGEEAIKHGG